MYTHALEAKIRCMLSTQTTLARVWRGAQARMARRRMKRERRERAAMLREEARLREENQTRREQGEMRREEKAMLAFLQKESRALKVGV